MELILLILILVLSKLNISVAFETIETGFANKVNVGPAYQHNNSYSRNEILLKTSKVICSEINNASFTNDPPFDELGNPVCNVPMEAMIFINHKGWMCSLDTKNLPSETNSHCFNIMKERSPSINKVVVIVHGYLGNFNLQWLHDMKDAIQSVEDTTAVIIIGWGSGSKDFGFYHQDAANTRYIAASLSQLMKNMHQTVDKTSIFPWLRSKMYTHCIGHSLGAHICGLSGKLMDEETKWDRISGLDPAGPLFFRDAQAFDFHCSLCSQASRLNGTDGNIVDVIHSDGLPSSLGEIQYGSLEKAGTIDFYPGIKSKGYGCFQPGCLDPDDVLESCSHSRSHDYYMASIANAVCLASRFCGEADPNISIEKCHNLLKHRKKIVVMGYWLTKADTTPGKYTVEVNSKNPFCAGST